MIGWRGLLIESMVEIEFRKSRFVIAFVCGATV